VDAGTIANGDMISDAIYLILNSSDITRVLTVSAANINPSLDVAISDGSVFNNMNKRNALNELLLASNSILYVDEDDNVIVTSRAHNTEKSPLRLHGPGDLRGRENISDIKNYNTGVHRVFNSITVNDSNVKHTQSITTFGARKKEITFDWITSDAVEDQIANELLEEFKFPKTELEVTISTFLAKDYDLLDLVSVNYPFKLFPAGDRIPFYGAAEYGDAATPYPYVVGSIEIPDTYGFKIIEIQEDPKKFQTTLKLRQIGVDLDDGFI